MSKKDKITNYALMLLPFVIIGGLIAINYILYGIKLYVEFVK